MIMHIGSNAPALFGHPLVWVPSWSWVGCADIENKAGASSRTPKVSRAAERDGQCFR